MKTILRRATAKWNGTGEKGKGTLVDCDFFSGSDFFKPRRDLRHGKSLEIKTLTS